MPSMRMRSALQRIPRTLIIYGGDVGLYAHDTVAYATRDFSPMLGIPEVVDAHYDRVLAF